MCLAVNADHDDARSAGHFFIFDDVGTVLVSKTSILKPCHAIMSETCVAIADQRYVYVWVIDSCITSLKSLGNWSHSLQNHGIERMYDCNDESEFPFTALNKISSEDKPTGRTISAVETSNEILFVGKDDGSIDLLSIHRLCRIKRIVMSFIPKVIAVNKDSTGVICMDDAAKSIRVYETRFDGEKSAIDLNLIFEEESAESVWMVRWSSDDSNTCMLLENDRLSIYDRRMAQRYQVGVIQSGCVTDFSKEKITVTSLEIDEYNGNAPFVSSQTFETRLFKETKAALINVENSGDLCTFISPVQSPTRTVLKMIAQFALERLYFKAAKKVSILLKDYDGMLIVEKLESLSNEKECRHEIDRLVQKRNKEASAAPSIDDHLNLVDKVNAHINTEDFEMAASCFFEMTEPFNVIEKVSARVDTTVLMKMGHLFQSSGLQGLAVECYSKVNSKLAVDLSLKLNRWSDAIRLASSGEKKDIKELARTQCEQLANGNDFQSGILYNQVGMHFEAATL